MGRELARSCGGSPFVPFYAHFLLGAIMPNAHRLFAGLATAVLTVSLAACGGGGGNEMTVNGQAITKAAFDQRLESGKDARPTMQQMVQESLIEQYAKDHNITVTNDEIDKKENTLKARYPNGQFDQLLKAQGLTEDFVRSQIRLQLFLDKGVGANIKVSDSDVKAYFNRSHATLDTPDTAKARHILVKDLATANKVEAELKGGKNFADEAKLYSLDPSSKAAGGELPQFKRGSMVPAFEKSVFSLPIGATSAPVKSPFGYHIIQVESRTMGQKATLASAHDQIVDTLRAQQEQPLLQPFLLGLQQKAKIDIQDPRFADLFPSPAPAAAAPAPAATK